jgi:hypothetical protein
MSASSKFLLSVAMLSLSSWSVQAANDVDEVKSYLVKTLEKVKNASQDFVKNSTEYSALLAQHGGPEKAWAADKKAVEKLVSKMQDNYKAMDSFGYETVEGIVAGVEKFAKYDVYLDAGLPKEEGQPEEVSPCKLTLSNGEVIDREGAPFTYIIEPALWGGAKKYVVAFDLNGDGQVAPRESLPDPDVLLAVAADTDKKVGELLADAKAWTPTVEDCYNAMVAMTPTLSDYFEDWKESRYDEKASGRFFAVSRLSDMQGIMKSCAVMYDAVEDGVKGKDKALARSVDSGFKDIFTFLDQLEKQEKKNVAFKVAQIDELAAQAKAKTDKLVPQIKQAAALAGVQISG